MARRKIVVPTSPLRASGWGDVKIATAWLRRGLGLGACEEVTREARQRGGDAGSGASRPPGRASTNRRSTRTAKWLRCTRGAAQGPASASLLGEVATTALPYDQSVQEVPQTWTFDGQILVASCAPRKRFP